MTSTDEIREALRLLWSERTDLDLDRVHCSICDAPIVECVCGVRDAILTARPPSPPIDVPPRPEPVFDMPKPFKIEGPPLRNRAERRADKSRRRR